MMQPLQFDIVHFLLVTPIPILWIKVTVKVLIAPRTIFDVILTLSNALRTWPWLNSLTCDGQHQIVEFRKIPNKILKKTNLKSTEQTKKKAQVPLFVLKKNL
jgi:hypothetical protein